MPAETIPGILFSRRIDSPLGALTLLASETRLVAVLWREEKPGRVAVGPVEVDANSPVLDRASAQLREYFAGERRSFDTPVDFRGTDFQKRVWNALLEIPYGETRTYGCIAKSLGDRNAVRAVGAAIGRNPIAIIAPCHRVIGSDGALTGFAGGLDAKRFLLAREGAAKK